MVLIFKGVNFNIMKKPYQKPALYVENFSLSQSIAATCAQGDPDSTIGRPNLANKFSCGWKDPTGEIIWVENGICTEVVDSDIDVGFGCYNNPSSNVTVFGWS